MNRRSLLVFSSALASLQGAAALAQGTHSHRHTPGPHGGAIGEVGERHVELVARDGEIRIYVLDAQDRPASARGASGSAVVQAGGRNQTIRLEMGPDEAFLVGRGDFAARGARVVATLTLPGHPQRAVRFPAVP